MESLTVYPNPATNNVQIEIIQVKETGATLQITNTIGQIVYSTTIAANQTAIEMTVDVSQFPAGIYNLQLVGETKVKGQQIVVQ
ncbi:MAG: T9SS type A sorting domain-containing protein [Chitinophagaceae bacterium]